jgi:hypothetical protein
MSRTCSSSSVINRPRSTPSASVRREDEMTEDALWLDGNALAGLLDEVLGFETTETPRGCRSCGEVNVIGAHRLYRGAGAVLRCPGCGDLALRIVTLPDSYVVLLAGTWRLEVPRPSAPRESVDAPLRPARMDP